MDKKTQGKYRNNAISQNIDPYIGETSTINSEASQAILLGTHDTACTDRQRKKGMAETSETGKTSIKPATIFLGLTGTHGTLTSPHCGGAPFRLLPCRRTHSLLIVTPKCHPFCFIPSRTRLEICAILRRFRPESPLFFHPDLCHSYDGSEGT